MRAVIRTKEYGNHEEVDIDMEHKGKNVTFTVTVHSMSWVRRLALILDSERKNKMSKKEYVHPPVYGPGKNNYGRGYPSVKVQCSICSIGVTCPDYDPEHGYCKSIAAHILKVREMKTLQ